MRILVIWSVSGHKSFCLVEYHGINSTMSLARFGDLTSFAKFASFSALGGITTYYLMNPREKRTVNSRNLIITTGCDSGLGYSIVLHCHDSLNMSVVACVHHLGSKGAMKLTDMFASSSRFHLVELEITKNESIQTVRKFVEDLLEKNKELSKKTASEFQITNVYVVFVSELTALVNNAGIMCFGETEWQTSEIIAQQIDINLTGTINVTKEFLPLVRQHQSRIINVTSHCGLRSLPGLPIYCATKAGLTAFTDALRLDMSKYGVDVVNFIPGSFVLSSNIASHQSKLAAEMRAAFTEEQLNFYGDYFDRYNKYLDALSGDKEPQQVDELIIQTFEEALLDVPAKTRYICEPLRYKLYHLLFKITPQKVTDWLLYKFVSMPEYDPLKSVKKM